MIDRKRSLMLLAAPLAATAAPVRAQNAAPYKIGMTFPLTGPQLRGR